MRAEPEKHGDVVLARKDFPTSYHLASVWDDALQGVTHVIRGEDLREAAHLHVLLQKLLDLPQPVYRHHRLVLGEDGKRLAKRDQAAHAARTARGGQDAGGCARDGWPGRMSTAIHAPCAWPAEAGSGGGTDRPQLPGPGLRGLWSCALWASWTTRRPRRRS